MNLRKDSIKRTLLLLTYCATMILIVINFKTILTWLQNFLTILTPFIWGSVLAFILNRPFEFFRSWFKKLKFEKGISLIITYVSFFIICALIVLFALPQLINSFQVFLGNVDPYLKNLNTYIIEFSEYFELEIPTINLDMVLKQLYENKDVFISSIFPSLFGVTSSIFSLILNGFLALVVSIYILVEKKHINAQIKKVLRANLNEEVNVKIYEVSSIIYNTYSNFINGQLVEACILSGICFVGMILFKFDYALLISVLVGFTNIIPLVGAYFGGFLAFLILVLINPIQAIWFLIYLIIIQQFESNVIYPRVVGSQIGLNGLWVLLAALVGGGLFGIVGMLVSVPTVSVAYQLLKKDTYHKLMKIEKAKEVILNEEAAN